MIDWIKRNKVTVIFIIAAVLLFAAISVVVANYLIYSNQVTGNVNPTPSPSPTPPPAATLTLEIDGGTSSTIYVGDTFTLTATLSDSANGVTVTFYRGTIGSGVSIGQDTTVAGVAEYTFSPAVGSYTYYAVADHP